jgi:bifunctional oligoribonuclease and PAP phosphatase NrnA
VIEEIARILKERDSFLITTHVDPDGDGLGSQCALFLALRKMGKRVEAVNVSPLPHRYRFLSYASSCRISSEFPKHDVCVTLDAGDLQRVREGVRRSEFGLLVNIDHHATNTLFGDVNWVDPSACATGEMVYRLMKALPVALDRDILDGVYTSLVADTGRFQYSNTTAGVLRLAAEMVEAGADLKGVSQHLFASESEAALRVLRTGLNNLKLHAGGRIGSMTLSRKELESSGATEDDTENLINFVRKVDTVVLSFFLKERADGRLKLSLRSKNGVDVSKIAYIFGGGGHPYAAGAVLKGPMDQAMKLVLEACETALEQHPA